MATKNKLRIMIADDHQLFIGGLNALLKEEEYLEIMGIASNGRELLELCAKEQPDLVLLDLNMPVMNGLDAARFLKQKYPALKMIILSTYNDEHLVEKAKQVGVNGYLLKNSSREELLLAINTVMNNQACFPYFGPRETSMFDKSDDFLKKYNLTKREMEIIGLIRDGLTNQQIAAKLFLSVFTVETHRKNIMHKLDLKTPIALHKFISENNI